MMLSLDTYKITPTHLARQAIVYVRQSTLRQVQRNVASTARQYDLSERANDLGWAADQVAVIDEDQAQSGNGRRQRHGFQHLVAEVGLGHVGAVLSLDASRLARASSDWYRLLEICALTQSLVIDEEGIYDPGQHNDRLLLGFKGTMSEAELHWIRSRLHGGKLELARQGKLRIPLPTGFIHDGQGQIIKDPDEAVQASIQQVFDQFERCQTARGVMLAFRDRQLLIPTHLRSGVRAGEHLWKPLSAARALNMLHNPVYAGVYVYGKTQTFPRLPHEGTTPVKQVKQDTPAIFLADHHPAYLTWTQYQRNQEQLTQNQNTFQRNHRGAVRTGLGLLQGLVICGRCGRRMKVRYEEASGQALYVCDGPYQSHGDQWCQAIRGHRIDAMIAEIVQEAMIPAQAEVALQVLEEMHTQLAQLQRQQSLQR